jgi:endonuclease-3
VKALARRALAIHDRLLEVYGVPVWRQTLPPLDELVSTILSQNTNDLNRDRAYAALRLRFPSWEAVRDARRRSVIAAIHPAGLGNQKGPRLQKALRQITAERGRLDLDFLRGLPPDEARRWLLRFWVGPKTTAIVLLFSLDMPAFPVDTHIYRVTGRLGLRPPKASVEQAHVLLEELFPPETYKAAHLNLIRLGREVCQARRPACERCPLTKVHTTRQWSLPRRADRYLTTDALSQMSTQQSGIVWPRFNALAFALGFVTNTLEPAVLGHRTLELAPQLKNTAFGLLTFLGILVAIAWQPVVGDLSDRTKSRWGRRLPYFVGGAQPWWCPLFDQPAGAGCCCCSSS